MIRPWLFLMTVALLILVAQAGHSTTTALYLTPTATPDVEALAEMEVAHNTDWTPYSQVFDGVEMVLVPQGCFMMGSTAEQIEYGEALPGGNEGWAKNESHVHEVCIEEPYWIDRYEVTNAQFTAFEGVAGQPGNWQEDERPRETVNWVEARDFCELRGMRLPTEAEWEFAARGPDSLIFPWGNEFIAENVVNDTTETAPVTSHPEGQSWVGAFHLSGNVWEWTGTIFTPYPYQENAETEDVYKERWSIRGGAYWDSQFLMRSAHRQRYIADSPFQDIGFRCAGDFLN